MKKLVMVAAGAMVLLVSYPGAAIGGGVSTLDLEPHYVVGDSEVVSQAVYFPNARLARIAMQRDWDLYLTPGWTEPVHLAPPDDAYRAGDLSLEPSPMSNVSRAEARIIVPAMPFGRYNFLVCSDVGCSSMVGDLYMPSVTIVESEGHAWMLRRIERMQGRQQRARHRLDEVRRSASGLGEDVTDMEEEIRGLVAGRDRLRDRIRTLENAEPIRSNPILPWMIAGAAITLLVVGAVQGARRRLAPEALDLDEDTAPGAVEIDEGLPSVSRDGATTAFDDSMWHRPKEPIDSN